MIQEAAGRLNRVLENLLDMTRLESGQLRLNMEWCDVNDLMTGALNRASADLSRHVVVRDVAPDLPLVRMDLPLMEQAVYNLLHNAAVHTPAGTRVRVTARVDGDQLLRGRGPRARPAARRPADVFDKFYRAPGAPVGGVGLGLSVTKGLVEAHGGGITAENRANGGVRFIIRLPLAEPPKHAGGRRAMTEGPRVLVIDDEPQICRFLEISLRANGFTVQAVATGSGGWRRRLSGGPTW